MTPLRLALCTPLPPERSGISDYSVQLLASLEPHFIEIRLFCPRAHRVSPELRHQYAVSEIGDLHHWKERDVVLYQIGNEPGFHGAIYEMALAEPGVVVLHEYMLQHLIRGLSVDRRRSADYVAVMRDIYGNQGEVAARRFLRTGAARELWSYPLFERIVDASRGVIVHNETTRRRILKSRPYASVRVIPPPLYEDSVRQEASAKERASIRGDLGIPPDVLVVGSFGLMSEAKRLEVAVPAFQSFRKRYPNSLYYLVGDTTPFLGLQSLLGGPQGEGVVVVGRQELPKFLKYMQVTDIAVNLRYPSGGETSATALRLLGMGTPLVVSDTGWLGELPDDVAVRIAVDDYEASNLTAALLTLAEEPDLRRRIGSRARQWIAARHAPDRCAALYVEAVQSLSRCEPLMKRQDSRANSSRLRSNIISEVGEALYDLGVEEGESEVLQDMAEALDNLGLGGQSS